MKSQSKKYAVFFDVDGTLVWIKTMFSFLEYYYQKKYRFSRNLARMAYQFFMLKIKFYYAIGKDRAFINAYYYKTFRGVRPESLVQLGSEWYADILRDNLALWRQDAIKSLQWHQCQQADIVLVSGSMTFCLRPIAESLGVSNLIAADLEVKNGKLTGELIGVPTIGIGKAKKIRMYLAEHPYLDSDKCYAYGDHLSDLEMLKCVGHPAVLKGDAKLEAIAKANQWPVFGG